MARRFFTVGEVERLIPTLERIFTEVLQLRSALRTQEQRLERAGVRVSRETLDAEERGGSPEVRHARALFRAFYDALAEALASVGKLGGEVKDVDIGLVDFPARRQDEDILLCWRFGERQVTHWHPVDSGYSGRRPIDEQVPREKPALD